MPSDELLYVAIALGSVVVALVAILIMEYSKTRETKKSVKVEELEPQEKWPPEIRRTVTKDAAEEAKNKLRILSLEREILSYAIRRLYEAQAEGKITEEERDSLAQKYKEDMRRIKEEIERGESIIALSELEKMQEDLFKLFNERFDELNRRIEELRMRSGLELVIPTEEEVEKKEKEEEVSPLPTVKVPAAKRKRPTKRRAPAPSKSEAERKVEQIMAEVEKVLERLEQMEVEE